MIHSRYCDVEHSGVRLGPSPSSGGGGGMSKQGVVSQSPDPSISCKLSVCISTDFTGA